MFEDGIVAYIIVHGVGVVVDYVDHVNIVDVDIIVVAVVIEFAEFVAIAVIIVHVNRGKFLPIMP